MTALALPTLRIHAARGLDLAAALRAFATTVPATGATGLVSSPTAFSIMHFDGGGLTDATGVAASLADVYEARVFHAAAELRWLKDPRHAAGHGAVILTDGSCRVDLPEAVIERPLVGTIEQSYLLWGRAAAAEPGRPGWARLTTARIGGMDVPIPGVRNRQRMAIEALEYLGEFDDGNVAVIEERLCGLTAIDDD